MSHTKRKATPYCLNCHYPTADLDSFCANCGQKATDGKISMHDLVHEFVHSITHIDGKIFTTLRHLFIPGKLTIEFFEGHHKRYAHPIQLFIVLCGLSLFFAGKDSKKLEESVSKGEINKVTVEGKNVLFELDSIAKIRYKNTPSVYDSFHNVLIEKNATYQTKPKTTLTEDAYKYTIDAIGNNKSDVYFLKKHLKNTTDTNNHFRLNRAIDIYQQRIDFLRNDSLILAQKLVNIEKKTPQDLDKLDDRAGYNLGVSFGKNLAKKGKQELSELDDIMLYADTVHAQYITQSIEDKLKLEKIKEIHTISRDSTRLIFVKESKIKLDDRDILNLSVSEIYKKYGIKEVKSKLFTRLTYNVTKDAQSITHSFFGKKIYVYVFLILPLAWFMQLLYRRQKRYYVEHVVFLMHYFCLSFLLDAPNLFIDLNSGWISYIKYILEYLIILPIAIKTYYQQSWGKSFIKGIVLVIILYVMALFIYLLGLLLSLVIA